MQVAAMQQAVESLAKSVVAVQDGVERLQLTPPVIAGNLSLLESNVDALARGIKRLTEQIRSVQTELASNAHARAESKFFVQFFTEPDAISAAIRAL